MLMTFDASATAALTLPSSSETLCRRLRDSVTAINEQLARPGSAEDISDALQKGLSEQLEVEFSEGGLTSSERHLADELLQKYTSEAWNFARKKDTFRVARERAF